MDPDQQEFYVSPIAEPVASDNMRKKILKYARKATEAKLAKRGVKEVVKALRKDVKGVCVLAADVSPVDVISHIPVYCEKKGVPYMFVRSRVELGVAAQTKRPTSVVLFTQPKDKELAEKFEEIKERVIEKNKYF